MQKRYLVWIALSFLLGILFAEQKNWIFAMALVLLTGIFLLQFLRADCKKQACLIALALGIGFLTGAWRYQSESDKREEYASVLIDDQPVQLQGELYKKETKQETNLLYLKNCHLKVGKQIYRTQDILVYHDNISYSFGNILCVEGKIKTLQKPLNEGGFDEKTYYESLKIVAKIYADRVRVVNGKTNFLQEGLFSLKQRIKQVYFCSMSKEEAGTMSAIALGEKGEMDSDVKQLYQDSGISHILSISGLHISIVGMCIFQFLRKRGISYVISAGLSFFSVYAFGILSGFGLSTKRAALMFGVYLVAQVLGQAYDSLTALAVAAMVLLIQNPFLLQNTAFQFSFLAVFAAGEIYPLLQNQKKGWQSFFVCFSVQIVTTPITLCNFYEIPTYVVLINLCVLPFVGLLLGVGLAGGLLGCIWSGGADLILQIPEWILKGYTFFLQMTQKLPGAVWITGKPRPWMLIVYYTILVLVVLVLKGKKERLRWQLVEAAYANNEDQRRSREEKIQQLNRNHRIWRQASMLVLSGSILFLCLCPQKKELEVDLLDVGQGDGIYLSNSSGTAIFIDGGSSSVKKVGTYRILPFLKSRGVRSVPYWFVSHTDADHINGIVEVLKSGYRIEHLVLAKYRGKGENEAELLQAAKEAGCEVAFMDAGEQLKCGKMTIKCLFPDEMYSSEDLNARSLVLEVQEGDFSGIFTGDIPEESERYLLQKQVLKPVLFYKAAHHGSKTSNSEAFLQALQPKAAAASAGKDNRYGHPAPEAVARIKEAGSTFFTTMDTGCIRIRLCKNGLLVEKYGKPLETRLIPVID